ncbi:MAG TPA: hypothetical protein PLQ76_03985, partial [bacterium]|nr:hypothetical protein [bacterium]
MRKKWVPSPVFLIFASVLLSAPGGAALCAYYMSRLGRRKQRTLFSVISIILIPVTAGALLTVRTRWYFFAGGLVAFNLIMGVFFMLAVHSPHREMALEMEAAGTKRFHAGARRVIFGILAGFIFGALAGQFFGLFYGWLADVFLSTLLPVNPDIFSQGEFVFFMTLAFMFSGGVIGGIAGGLVRNDGLSAAVKPAISLIATATALMFMWHFFVDVIAFHSYGIAADPYRADLPDIARIVFPLLFTGFSVIGALVINGSSGARELAGRTVLVFFMCLMLTLTTVCYTGIVSYDFLILGKMREKRGDVKGALALYEKSLTLYPSPFSASYLQFRIGLLNHVRGDDAAAADAFRNVLTKYTANKHFVQQAKILSDRLENVKKGERFVLPGVETRTEYRSAYCAPNSMALVFNYWRKNKLTAKKIGTDITYTLFGTSALDMLFYARENGFEYYLTSDNSLNDIREFVKKKIPVLVFIPQHVFVVFGYDMRLDTLISYDVATYDVWVEHPAEDFVAEWSKTGRMMAIM